MLDFYLLRNSLEDVFKRLLLRNFRVDKKKFFILERKRKIFQKKYEELKIKSKKISDFFYKNKNLISSDFYKKNNILKRKLEKYSNKLNFVKEEIQKYISTFPNLPQKDVPIGENDKDNVVVSYWGEKKTFNFPIKNHIDLGNKIDGLDFQAAAKVSGSRFVFIKNELALLYRGLMQFMLDVHIKKHNYTEYIVPVIVNQKSLYGTGQIPKFKKDLFYVSSLEKNQTQYFLIPTAEVPLTNICSNQILKEENLPIKMVSCSSCFRSEPASYGKDNRGLIRMHQFEKVELVQIVHPDTSQKALDEIVKDAEKILKLLQLPYRKVLLSTNSMSFSSAKTYDLEVWVPSKNSYCEVSSCSNMTDFQARRMKTRYRNKNKKIHLVHTLNGSGLAIGRTLLAILENYQEIDGSIKIPKVLIPYVNIKKIFIKNKNLF